MSDPRPLTELDDVRAELAALRAEVAQLRAERTERARPAPAEGTVEPAVPEVPASGAPIPRRAALRHAAGLAAGAVAGGAAIVTATASPAAAATVSGVGNPGVEATGVSGDGVIASTNLAGKAAVRGGTGTAGAVGIVASHSGVGASGGAALTATSPSPSGRPATVVVSNTGGGTALQASVAGGTPSDRGKAAAFDGIVTVATTGANAAFQVSNTANIIWAQGVGDSGTGYRAMDVNVGAVLETRTLGARIETERTHLHLEPTVGVPPPERPPAELGNNVGSVVMHGSDLWLCVASTGLGGTGTWRRLGGASSAGSLTVLDVPGRAYDSRPGTQPPVGSKTKLQANVTRVVDLTAGGRVPIPAGATAAVLTLLLVNATAGSGNLTVWANGAGKPQANTMVWGGNAGRFTATAVSRIDGQARVQVAASLATDVVIDVVGFHR